MDYITSRMIPAFHRFLQHTPGQSAGTLDEAREAFLNTLKEFTKEMDPTGPWFLGSEPSVIDFVAAPWGVRLWPFDEMKGGLKIPEDGEDRDIWARWHKWVKAVEGRKSVQETTSENQYLRPIYQKYADNIAQSELAKATRAGKGVP